MRRWPRLTWIDRGMLVLLGLYVAATIGSALVGAVTLLDVNLLTRFQPFTALQGPNIAPTNVCRGDTVDAIMPGLAQIRTGLLSGHLPAWSSSEVGGAPLGGIPIVGQFSPLALPYYLFPLWLAPAFVKLAEFAVAIGGMVAFLRRLRLSTAAGVLAGIVFASSGFMLSWTNWPQTRVAAFIPALFWATERLVQRHRPVDALPLAVVVASMLLGGFPAVTGFALYGAGLYFLVRVVVVDNSSRDDTVDVARRALPEVEVVQMGENRGYAAAINGAGLKPGDHDAVVVLNPDTEVGPGSLRVLAEALEGPGVGFSCQRCVAGTAR